MPHNNQDLSGDGPEKPPGSAQSMPEDFAPQDTAPFNAQGQLYQQRYEQRRWLFGLAIAAAAVMTAAFLSFVYAAVRWTWKHPDKAIDWHILLLGSALIVPPTLVVWNLMKQVFRSDGKLENGKGDDGGSGILLSDVIKEITSTIKEWLARDKTH